MKNICFSELPATFRDAVTITRNLDCQYLWIDSLCIIQDSVEDCQRECAKMSQVYRYSLLTLSALHSANSNAGIFTQRTLKPSVEVAPEKSPGWGPIYVTLGLDSWNEMLGRSILNTRGWTLQERVLSPRLLHFSDDELLWECLTCVQREGSRKLTAKSRYSTCEESYTGPSLDVNMPPADWSKQKLVLSFLNEWSGGESKVPFLTWNKAVSYFSGRNLTYGKDKLPAISGLAAEVCLQTGATYLAGLFKEDLPNGLCWQLYPGNDASFVQRPSDYRAPSWSWASLDGKVEYFEPPTGMGTASGDFAALSGSYVSSALVETMDPCVTDAQVPPLGEDPFGEVSSGFISFECVGLEAFIFPDPSSDDIQKSHKILLGIGQQMLPKGDWFFEADKVGFRGVIDSINDLGISQCIFIPLARRKVERDNVITLLVTPVSERSLTFRRIGISWMGEEVAIRLFRCYKSKIKITLI